METRKILLTDDLIKGVSYTAKMEGVDESSALSQLLKLGVLWYATNLYKLGKITLAEAADKSYRLCKKIQIKHAKYQKTDF